MDNLDEEFDEGKRDTVSDGEHVVAAVKAELLSDAAEDVVNETTHERIVARVEEQTGLPTRMAHEVEVESDFDIGVYRRPNDDEFPGLLLTTSVVVSDFENEETAVEELQQRRDTLCRVCEEMDFSPYILEGDELESLIEGHREHDGN